MATVNPLSVVTMSPYKDKALYMSLQGLVGSSRYARSQVSLVALGGSHTGSILVHEGTVSYRSNSPHTWKHKHSVQFSVLK